MRHRLLLLALLPLAACAHPKTAGNASRRCTPSTVSPQYAAFGQVYTACEVDRQAQVQRPSMEGAARMEAGGASGMPRASMPSQRCSTAEVEFVIDTEGHVIPESVRLVRTTDNEYGQSVVRMASRMRYTPAQKKGEPVMQVTQMKLTRGTVVVRSGSVPSSTRPPSC